MERRPRGPFMLALGFFFASLALIDACSLDVGGLPSGGAGGAPSSATYGGSGMGSGEGPACGHGRVETGEDCDDGHNGIGDGCSAGCKIEALDACPGPGFTLV